MAGQAQRAPVQKRSVAGMKISATAKYLQDHLGQQLVSVLTGVTNPKTVGRWASGKATPAFEREVRLRVAYDAAKLIIEEFDDASTARAWFLGSSPYLDHEAPAIVLSESRTLKEGRQIMPAALSFLEGAY